MNKDELNRVISEWRGEMDMSDIWEGPDGVRLEVEEYRSVSMVINPKDAGKHYRPLTCSEVEEYSKQWERRDIESLIAFVQAITKLEANDYYTYKGAKVRIGK